MPFSLPANNDPAPFQDLVIERIDIYKMTIPLTEPFVISLGPVTHAQNTVIRIHTRQGLYGVGECSPFPTIHGETQESNFAVAKLLAPLLIGKNPLAIDDRLDELDKAIAFNPCIKSAFDMALYDLKAKYCQLPLYALLGGANRTIITTDMTVSIGTPEGMAKQAAAFVAQGFEAIKVKLGGTTTADTARIKAIRAAIGEELPLRIDANQAWTVKTAIATLNALAPFDIEHCEAPIPRWNSHQLATVKAHSPIPIMADESLFDHHDAQRLLSWGAVDYFNIKLSKSGGIRNALRIAAIAEGAGIKSQVGCFSETRLGISALAHFALASSNVVHYDMDSPLMLAEDPVLGGIRYGEKGLVSVPDNIGIGADFEEVYLKKLDQVTIF
ncbi:MAG: dipeptide epimerase [Saprospiraceae bacterium]